MQAEDSDKQINDLVRSAISLNKIFEKRIIQVRCLHLQTLLRESQISSTTIFSIDCEGCELEVLKDFDFSAVEIMVLLVERSGNCTYTNQLMSFVEGKGFIAMNWESSDITSM